MSTLEMAYQMLEQLSEEELKAFILLFGHNKNNDLQKKSAKGAWSFAANPELIPLEEGAWERAATERYGKKHENT